MTGSVAEGIGSGARRDWLDEGAVDRRLVVDDGVGVEGRRARDALDPDTAVGEGEPVRDEDRGDLREAAGESVTSGSALSSDSQDRRR